MRGSGCFFVFKFGVGLVDADSIPWIVAGRLQVMRLPVYGMCALPGSGTEGAASLGGSTNAAVCWALLL